jgi:hypothetical protein
MRTLLTTKYKKYIRYILGSIGIICISSVCYAVVSTQHSCSPSGYTVATINGINTTDTESADNMDALASALGPTYADQNIDYEYLYNPTHTAALGDIVDTIRAGMFNQTNTYDLKSILTDASQKIQTQKVLLVGHSEGNFYVNGAYHALADQSGGVPAHSLAVFAIATPADTVAGVAQGKENQNNYITSDTDVVVNTFTKRFMKVLPPTTHIALHSGDDIFGHSLSDVYLRYKSDLIVSKLQALLAHLQSNTTQNSRKQCIASPTLTAWDTTQKIAYAITDPLLNSLGAVVYSIPNSFIKTYATDAGFVATLMHDLGKRQAQNPASAFDALPTIPSDSSDTKKSPVALSVPLSTHLSASSVSLSPTKPMADTTPVPVAPLPVTVSTPPTAEPVLLPHNSSVPTQNPIIPPPVFIGGSSSTPPPPSTTDNTDTSPVDTTVTPPDTAPSDTNDTTDPTQPTDTTDTPSTTQDTSPSDSSDQTDVTPPDDTTTTTPPDDSSTSTDTPDTSSSTSDTPSDTSDIPPDTTPPVITLNGDTEIFLVKGATYIDAGATAVDDVDGDIAVVAYGVENVNTSVVTTYVLLYTATDQAGNMATVERTVHIVAHLYISKDTFGLNNGDGNDWQVWAFNGSNIYDWSDTYVGDYLREQFKVQAYAGGFWCSECLQRGIFNRDPRLGFDYNDVSISGLEDDIQNNSNDTTYDVAYQWDSSGYTYTISHGDVVDTTGHTNVSHVGDSWVGWDDSFNNFKTFPLGTWQEKPYASPVERTGGGEMVITPYKAYVPHSLSDTPTLSMPTSGPYAGDGIDPTRGRTDLTPFTFTTIYTDPSNTPAHTVTLHITDAVTSSALPDTAMTQTSTGTDVHSDGDFTNGEAYTFTHTYPTGKYDYFFTAVDSTGTTLRIPETGTLRFSVIPSTYVYIPHQRFGTDNGDGKDWQVWMFNGSGVSDWSDTYVNHYLDEHFKMYTAYGFWCSECIERGIFNHDPQRGFEKSDVTLSSLENSPQNNRNNTSYDIDLQWDATGYTYTITHTNPNDQTTVTDATGHTTIDNVNADTWVGWDDSFNNFKTFPKGIWQEGSRFSDPKLRPGGMDMVLQPYPVYSSSDSIVTPPADTSSDTSSSTTDTGDTTDTTQTTPPPQDQNTDTTPPIPDATSPTITDYALNGTTGNMTIDPLTDPLTITLTASEEVNWLSIKIENVDDPSLYRIFQSSASCADGTTTCTKTWDGVLSRGGLLHDGNFRIKVHMKDTSGNEYDDYLTSVITVTTSV